VVRVPYYRFRGSRFDYRRYRIFWEVVGLERGPLSLVSTIEELLETRSSGSGLEIGEYGRRDPSRWPHGNPYPQEKLAISSPTSGGRSVGIVPSRTQTMEFSLVYVLVCNHVLALGLPANHRAPQPRSQTLVPRSRAAKMQTANVIGKPNTS
jgi:hypothetical protein